MAEELDEDFEEMSEEDVAKLFAASDISEEALEAEIAKNWIRSRSKKKKEDSSGRMG